MNASDPIYLELVDFVAGGTTPQDVVDFRPSAQAQQRVNDLIERERESRLTAEEAAELAHFLELEQILRMAKAKARLILAKSKLRVTAELRAAVARHAGFRCEYCLIRLTKRTHPIQAHVLP